MSRLEAKNLLKKYQDGECTPEELAIVEHYIIHKGITPQNLLELEEEFMADTANVLFSNSKKATLLLLFKKSLALQISTAAAALFLIVTVPMLFKKDTLLPKNYANDIEPGKNDATLTLANGKKINLSAAKDGPLESEGNIQIVKSANGQIVYKINDSAVLAAPSNKRDSINKLVIADLPVKVPVLNQLNSLTTPRGGQYNIILPDGTRVWINSGSTLKFPSTFYGATERRVELIGEAYFEVSQVKSVFGMQRRARKVPFIVQTNKQEVTVLGTHFNINSYADEPNIKTTLLEGLVKVSSTQGEALLKPGYQSINSESGVKVVKVDTENVIAWKNGEFAFRNENLETIMRKVARWYNVEIIYENKEVGKQVFGGSMSKFGKISEVLCMLELTGDVHFKVEGRRITIMK